MSRDVISDVTVSWSPTSTVQLLGNYSLKVVLCYSDGLFENLH